MDVVYHLKFTIMAKKAVTQLSIPDNGNRAQRWLWNSGYKPHYDPLPPTGRGKLMTKPGQTLTIPEIIARFESGRSAPVGGAEKHMTYTGEDEQLTGVDIRTLDLVDIHDMAKRLQQNAETVNLEINRRHKAEQDEKLRQSVEKKFLQRLKNETQSMDDEARNRYLQSLLTD